MIARCALLGGHPLRHKVGCAPLVADGGPVVGEIYRRTLIQRLRAGGPVAGALLELVWRVLFVWVGDEIKG